MKLHHLNLSLKDQVVKNLRIGCVQVVIRSLELSTGGIDEDNHSDLIASELNQARVELKMCRDELAKSCDQLSRSRAELNELERIHELESASHMTSLTELQEDYNELSRLREDLEQENKQIKGELRCVQEELSRL